MYSEIARGVDRRGIAAARSKNTREQVDTKFNILQQLSLRNYKRVVLVDTLEY